MRSPPNKQHGIVAILDALGAASYGDAEIKLFLKSRQEVLDLLTQKIEGMPQRIERASIDVFTFNDTILIAYKTGQCEPDLQQIETFFIILRKFFVDSLSNRILFRGAVAIGSFFVARRTNTVMGQAVTDAAAWYDKADWIGIQVTPKGSMIIQHWLEKDQANKSHLVLDYEVPLKDGTGTRVKAVNWPRVFHVPPISPCGPGEKPREMLLQLLSIHPVPAGTEKKFSNAIAFVDYVGNRIQKANKVRNNKRSRPIRFGTA